MEHLGFRIVNFKGISDQQIQLNKHPTGRIFSLVGLNESGKTTILEAISLLDNKEEHPESLYKENFQHINANEMIPMKSKANFNGSIRITATISLTKPDIDAIILYCKKKLSFNVDRESISHFLKITKEMKYKNSIYEGTMNLWTLSPIGIPVRGKRKRKLIEHNKEKWDELIEEVNKKIPTILYFPTFLFEFPQRIYITENPNETHTNSYYRRIVQDILDSIDDGFTIDQHIVKRVHDGSSSSRSALEAVLLKMGTAVSRTIFEAWNDMFGKEMPEREIVVRYYADSDQIMEDEASVYLEFSIREGESMYLIAERSLGFRWFFCFMLFTQFRQFRRERGNALFLFDEPASTLHSRAQKQLLRSFEVITNENRGKIIYSTHSHHMINPKWLENTFIVSNEGVYNNEESMYMHLSYETNIAISRYRTFVSEHPTRTTFFQPILNAIEYSPNALEFVSNAVFVEGKNDFYTIQYFNEIVLDSHDPLSILPGTSASGFDLLISLYLGWGKRFIILLDDDAEGRKNRARYVDEWYLPTSQVVTLGDLSPNWKNYEMEDLLMEQDIAQIRSKFYPSKKKGRLTKKEIARALQEKLICRDASGVSEGSIVTFTKLISALSNQLETYGDR